MTRWRISRNKVQLFKNWSLEWNSISILYFLDALIGISYLIFCLKILSIQEILIWKILVKSQEISKLETSQDILKHFERSRDKICGFLHLLRFWWGKILGRKDFEKARFRGGNVSCLELSQLYWKLLKKILRITQERIKLSLTGKYFSLFYYMKLTCINFTRSFFIMTDSAKFSHCVWPAWLPCSSMHNNYLAADQLRLSTLLNTE